jgi:hypothetical protein
LYAGSLQRLRFAWAALLVVEVVVIGVTVWLAEREIVAEVSSRKAGATVFVVAAAAVTTVLFAGLLARKWLFAPNHDGAVALQNYIHGTVVLHLCCAAGVVMTLAMIVLTGRLMPLLLVTSLALLTQLASFPAGSVLRRRSRRSL